MARSRAGNAAGGGVGVKLFFLIIISLISGTLTWFLTLVLRRWALRVGLVDVPNERSSHRKPTPRGGGLSFVVVAPVMTVVAVFSLGMAVTPRMWTLLVGCLLVAAVSLADDRRRLPILIRFGAHLVGALILMAGSGYIHQVELPGGRLLSLGGWGLLLTFIWIVGLTNAYNFMDGIDGIAAGQAVIAAATIVWLAQLRGAGIVAWAMAIIAGSALGFLPHNWPPAKIFMGDVGSAFLGFTFAGWAVVAGGTRSSPLPFLAWVVVLAPFVFDTTATLISRIMRRQRWYEAHREHFYQRLLRRGWSHLAVTSLYLGVAAFLGLTAIAFYGYQAMASTMFIGLVVLPLAGIAVLVRWVETRSA
jgi:UDP-N-acetylmuramyl pentapeptide phosphotransferase/UDP-N-acetylglucosamine-1-phosphate transferase